MLKFLEDLQGLNFYLKRDDLSLCDSFLKDKIITKLNFLIEAEKRNDCVLLFRGTKKEILKKNLINKINSNDSLFDGLFLVGDKAKNYLKKAEEIPHPIKQINTTGDSVADWIFDEYANLKVPQISHDYFENSKNKKLFISKVGKDFQLIDYYLFGLHTLTSEFLVNFVSTTRKPDVALDYENDLIILLWLPENYKIHTVSKYTLDKYKGIIIKNKLPILQNSLFENEEEFSFKGFILPHFIFGVYDLKEKRLVVNSAILKENNHDWITDGLEIDGDLFLDFIKSTKYERFLTLYDNQIFKEEKTFAIPQPVLSLKRGKSDGD